MAEELNSEHVEVPADLLELYEVLEYTEHPAVMDFPRPLMASSMSTVPLPNGFVSRQQWGARPPTGTTKLTTAKGNTAHYEGVTLGDYPHSSCATKMRGIQRYHMDSRKYNDIAYSSVSGCIHGAIYEGRWYGLRTAANGTNVGNDRSYAHCVLMGPGDTFTDQAKRALRDAFVYFEARGSGTERKVHSDWKPTQCPDDPIRKFVKVDNLFIPEVNPPAPTPGMTLIESVEVDMKLDTYSISIGTSAAGQPNAGNGWVRVPFSRSQIKGYTPGGNRPEHDKGYETAEVGFAQDDLPNNPGTVIQVTGWAPGWPCVVDFTVAVT